MKKHETSNTSLANTSTSSIVM